MFIKRVWCAQHLRLTLPLHPHTHAHTHRAANIVRPKNAKINISATEEKKPTQKRATFTTKFYIVQRIIHITILHKIKFVVLGFTYFWCVWVFYFIFFYPSRIGLNLALIYTKHVCGMFRLPLSFRMSFCCSFACRPETKAKRNLCQSAVFHFSFETHTLTQI